MDKTQTLGNVKLLDNTRKIEKLLHRSSTGKVVFNDICNVMSSILDANMFVVCTYIIWNALPFKILVLMGGLQNVNKQYYEAAKIDSTTKLRTFFRITIPLVSPMLAYVIITSFIGGFKEYSSIVGIFGETMGPAGSDGQMNTIVGFVYKMLPSWKTGVASAASLILFGIILIVTAINGFVSKRTVHY